MHTKTEDKRVRRTKRAIREALLRLILDKPIEQVSTTELCRVADINRNTFYAHYSTPEEAFAEIVEELLCELNRMLDADNGEGDVTYEMCRAIDEDQLRWHSIWHGKSGIIEQAIDICCERALAKWDVTDITSEEEAALFLRFVTRGASGVVGSWLDGGCRMAPEEVSSLINRFVREGQHAIMR